MSAGVSNKIAKGLCKAFKGAAFTKTGCCTKLDTKYFIEGITIERTLYKETFYVWSFINPIWKRRCLGGLGYSERIAGGRYFVGSAERITEEIIFEVRNNALYLARISGPETTAHLFLNEIHSKYPSSSQYGNLTREDWAFDFGIALALENKIEDSRKSLEAFLRIPDHSQHYFRLCAREIVASFSNGNQAYLDVISDMEGQGRSLLPFELHTKQ